MNAKHLLNLVGDRLHTLPLIVLYLTDGCNSRCVTCDIWRNPRRNMSWELVEKIASECHALQTRWVLLSGGEAMQHPDWPRIAQRFHSQGIHVMLLTNGLLLRKQMDAVVASVDELIVSLDAGTAQTYSDIRGVDGFDLVMDGIHLVREANLPVTTRTTIQRANFRELPQIIEVACAADVNHISFLAVDVSNPIAFGPRFQPVMAQAVGDIPLVANMGPGAPPEHGPLASALTPQDTVELAHILDQIEIRYADLFDQGRIAESPEKMRRILLQYFNALNGDDESPRPRCNAPHFSTVIDVDGTLRPCYFLPGYGRLGGDTTSLHEVLNNGAAQALLQAYRTGQRTECERCVCPLYKGPRMLLQM